MTLRAAAGSWLPLAGAGCVAVGAMGLRIRQLTGHLRRRAVVAEAVAQLSHWALSADQPDQLLREALRVAVAVTGADYGTALRRLPDGALRVAEELGPQPLPPGTLLPIAPERSYALHVVETGRPFLSGDLRTDPRVAPPVPLLDRGVVSGLAVPVHGSQGVLGVLALHSSHRRQFRPDDVAVAGTLATVVATAWEQVAQRERLGHQALHDSLTGLPNRTLFLDRLEHALIRRPSPEDAVEGSGVAVVLIDLDDFKGVNDSFGHAAGDAVLVAAARRFDELVRPQDTLARLGGDEFALLCEPVPDQSTVLDIVHRMRAALDEPIDVAGSSLRVSATFGLTWQGRDASASAGAGVLLGEADAALYRAKERGRGRVQAFDERLQRSTGRRRQLEAELQGALERDELRLHYQPVRRSTDLHCVGVEALLRWQHPTRGLLLPDQFIPTAERTGLLLPIGTWVLRTACRQVSTWRRAAPDDFPWLAVNVSPRQLDDPRLADTVAEALQDNELPGHGLALELTETAIMAGDGKHRAALEGLRHTGAQLFLDDFGTGYSSLTHLTELPIDAVKIDRSFVADLPQRGRSSAVVSSLISLSAELGLDVIAEGVETTGQLRALDAMHCQAVQGFLLDRPEPEPLLTPLRLPA